MAKRERVGEAVALYIESREYARACEEIVQSLGEEIRRYLMAVTLRRSRLDDVYQDVLEQVLIGLPRFRGSSSVETWVFTVARNVAIMDNRRYSRDHVQALDSLLEQRRFAPGPGLSTVLTRKQLLSQALERLRPDDREVLFLRIEQERPFSEIAEILGAKNPAVVRKRYERARGRLAELLIGQEGK